MGQKPIVALELNPTRTLLVLTGAGFSRALGLPLQKELLEAVVPRDMIKVHNYMMGRSLDAPADCSGMH